MGSEVITPISLVGVNAALGVVAIWLLPMRHHALFMALMLIGAPIASLTLASSTTMNIWNIIGYLGNYVVLPCLFWQGRPAHRFVCSILLLFLEFLFEMTTALVFVVLGIPLDRNTVGPEIAAARCVNIVFCLMAGRLIARVVARTLHTGEPTTDSASAARCRAQTASPALSARHRLRPLLTHPYLIFFLTQFAFVSQATLLLMTYRNADARAYAIMIALLVVCFVADAIALFSWRRFATAERSRAHSVALEQQLAIHASHARAAAEDAGRVARLRHDERNHLQVLTSLIDSGEVTRAHAYTQKLRSELAPGGESA